MYISSALRYNHTFVNEKKLKKLLKSIKLNESSISMVLGLIILLIVGTLVFNYFKSSKGSIPEELLSGINSIEQTSKVHTVKKGENLWNIAVLYYSDGFKWVDIATENKLPNASIIEEGQELLIPNIDNEEKVTVNEAKDNTNITTSSNYTVKKGDSLWTIAVQEYGDGYKWTEIAKTNNLTHPSIIHIGNVLVLP